jgi:hypothetical protein
MRLHLIVVVLRSAAVGLLVVVADLSEENATLFVSFPYVCPEPVLVR